jgi:hypothetical protein
MGMIVFFPFPRTIPMPDVHRSATKFMKPGASSSWPAKHWSWQGIQGQDNILIASEI